MKGLHFVCVMCVWLLPQRLHGTGTPAAQTLNVNLTTAGVMASETRQPFSNTAQQHRPSASQAHDYLSTKNTVMAKSLSTGPLSSRTKRALALGQTDGQTTRPNKSSASTSEKMESKVSGGQVSSSPIQATNRSATPGALEHTTISLIILNQSTKIQPSQTPSKTRRVALSQTNSSTVGIQSTKIDSSTSSTPALITQAEYSSSFSQTKGTDETVSPTDKDLTDPSQSPANATSDTTPPSTERPKPTSHISTRGTSARPAENDSTSHQSISKTSKAPTKKPIIPTTKAKKKLSTPSPKPRNRANSNEKGHATAVAVLIGGALVLMMFGFLLIYLKKRKLRKQQADTADWAGPSPFLDKGPDNNGQIERRSSNRISLSGFLPQRLSKRLSLLKEVEMEQELQVITPGTTFRREVNEDEENASNGTAVVVVEVTQLQEIHNTERPPSPVASTPPPAAAPLVDVDLEEEHSATSSPVRSSPTNEPPSTPPPAATPLEDVDLEEEHSATSSPVGSSPDNEPSSTPPPAAAPLKVVNFGEERSTPPAPPDATGDNTPLPRDDDPMPNLDQPNPSPPPSESAVNGTPPNQPSLVST